MEKLILFFKQSYLAIISIAMEIIAICCYANSSAYTEARFADISRKTLGRFSMTMMQIGNFISLKEENLRLTERIADLENKLEATKTLQAFGTDTAPALQTPDNALCIPAKIVSSSTNKPNNFLTIDKGYSNKVAIGDALLSPEGYAVGHIVLCSEHYSIAKSLLNTNMKVSGELKKNKYIGSVHWEGGDIHTIDFTEIDRYAQIVAGDEVVAAGFSHIFPSGTLIGYVETITYDSNQSTQQCKVRLAANFSTLRNVIIYKQEEIIEAVNLEMNLENVQ